MKTNIRRILFVVIVLIKENECKGGRGGFGRGGGFSRSKPSSSSSWFSKPSYSSRPAPSPSYSSYKPAPSYGWNVNKPSGPPPAYPGLSNRPVKYGNSPPSYSPSYSHHPSYYSPSNTRYSGYNSYPNYGSTFGSTGLRGNTYIHNNYYGSHSGGSPFLTNALFYGAGMHHGYSWGSHNSYRHRSWSDEDDRRWRMTTKAPYFENKVPGSEKVLPAAAVVGAATAFGLISLLPLNVPPFKPLMYCNGTEIAQSPINIDDKIYRCSNKSILISSCDFINENQVFNEDDKCVNKTMECHSKHSNDEIFCDNGTLLSRSSLVCNSTTFLNGTQYNETLTILNCFKGEINAKLASFIPTTTTEEPSTTTTEKNLSVPSRIHVFFMKIIGKEEALKKITTTTTTTTTTDDPRLTLKEDDKLWAAEAMTIPPETTTTSTTEAPYVVMKGRWVKVENGSVIRVYDEPLDALDTITYEGIEKWGFYDDGSYKKVLITTESALDETTTLLPEVYSGGPYVMMRPSRDNSTNVVELNKLNLEEYLSYKAAKILGKEYFYDYIYKKVPFAASTSKNQN